VARGMWRVPNHTFRTLNLRATTVLQTHFALRAFYVLMLKYCWQANDNKAFAAAKDLQI
jgi:hypothetical protein